MPPQRVLSWLGGLGGPQCGIWAQLIVPAYVKFLNRPTRRGLNQRHTYYHCEYWYRTSTFCSVMDQCFCRATESSDSVYQYTALHIAALSACVRCLRACISEGYDVNSLSISGQTPLFLASYVSNSPEERRAEVRISLHSPPFRAACPT